MFTSKKTLMLLFGAVASVASLSANNSYMHKDGHHCPVLCPISPLTPESDCCHNMHIDIGLIYQQPTIPEMYPAYIYESIQNETIDSVDYERDQVNNIRPCFDYAIGLTVSLGYLMKHDDWYLGARFDWLSEDVTHKYDLTDETTKSIYYYVSYQQQDLFDAYDSIYDTDFTRMTYKAHIDIYALDVLLSRGSYHSTCFSYEPFAGVKAVWFATSQNGTSYNSASNVVSVNPKQNNWGAGPMFGFNGEYHIVEGLSIFSDSDIALLYGEAHETVYATYQDYDSDGTLNTDYRTTTYDKVDCVNYLVGRSILGLKFSQYCLEDKHYVAIKIGYDVRSVISYGEIDRGFNLNGLYTDLIWNF